MREIKIVGAGPAGTAAAIAARSEGAEVQVVERHRTARHKVCGEFIPPEAARVLERLGVWQEFLRRRPACIRRCVLTFGSRSKEWTLSEPAYGLSRFTLDQLILDHASGLGARISRGEIFLREAVRPESPLVLAKGRSTNATKASRLFGFKAHFTGLSDDAVRLYFLPRAYVGISSVENGMTNVCGLAPEDVLRRYQFDIDTFLFMQRPVAERIGRLSRCMPWLHVGPLVFSPVRVNAATELIYPAGDSLAFVDPFTGSGILNALLTGRMAGIAAARLTPADEYLRSCEHLLAGPMAASRLLRLSLHAHLGRLASFIPGDWLYRLTRAHVASCGNA